MTDASDGGQHSDHIPRSVIENEQIFNAFQNSILNQVNQRLDEKLARRLTSNIAIIGLAISVLTATGGYITDLIIEKEINERFEKFLEDESEKIVQEAEFLPRVARLEIQLAKMDAADGISSHDVEWITNEFEVLYSEWVSPLLMEQAMGTNMNNAERIRLARARRSQFATSFNLLVKILSAIDHLDEVERLAELAPGLAQNSDTAFQALTQSYGRQIIGAAGAPNSWKEGEPFQETFQRYREWSSRARENGFPNFTSCLSPLSGTLRAAHLMRPTN